MVKKLTKMSIHYFCKKCKKVSNYDGRDKFCCKTMIGEIYKCDGCRILLDENDIHLYERGIECFELCGSCTEPK